MCRFNDIKEVMVCDVKLLGGIDLEVYVQRCKTDQEGRGSTFHMSGEKYDGFLIPGPLCWYLESTGLSGSDYLFLRFRGSSNGRV